MAISPTKVDKWTATKTNLLAVSYPYIKYAWRRIDDPVVYVRISGMLGAQDEFTSGEYIAEIVMGDTYPITPPHVKILTPNGITQLNTFISINRFGFHSEGYSPSIGVAGISMLVVAVFIQWRELGSGVGLIAAPDIDNIRAAAQSSRDYNRTNLQEISLLFE